MLARLKAHLHIDHDDDDAQLLAYFAAAQEYLEGAGVSAKSSELYFLTAANITGQWYDAGSTDAPIVGLRGMINQLKLSNVADGGIL